MTSPIDRFIAASETASQNNGHGSTFTEEGIESALAQLREAELIARQMLIFGHPLDAIYEPFNHYCNRKKAEVLADPQHHDGEDLVAVQESAYYVGLALGLLLGDRV